MRSRRRMLAIATVAALAGTLGAVAPASAGVPQGSTAIEFKTTVEDGQGGLIIVIGRVVAQPQQCAKSRRVELQIDRGSGLEVTDAGRSSRRGYFALAVKPQMDPQRAVLVAPRSKVKAGGGRVTCKRATFDII